MQKPKLRDSKKRTGKEQHPIGELPESSIIEISKWIAYSYAVGKEDINGDDWGNIFAKAIRAKHLASPLGLADIILDNQCWSSKTVKSPDPYSGNDIRIISGRNSPDYSYGIQNPHDDPQKTGVAVLNIWNERVNIALDSFSSLRSITLIRNFNSFKFCLFETEINRFPTNEYEWRVNKNGNLEGYNISNGEHKFTWQPHGSQFTIKYGVPRSAIKFSIRKPEILDFDQTIKQIGFDESWVEIT